MSSELELERLMIRLVGDAGDYTDILSEAITDSVAAANKIESLAKESAAQAEMLAAATKHIGPATQAALAGHAAGLMAMNDAFDEGLISEQEYEQGFEKLNQALRDVATAEVNAGKAIEENNRQLVDADRIVKSLITPQQKYDAEVQNLKQHLEAGRITQDQYNQAIGNLVDPSAKASMSMKELGRNITSVGRSVAWAGAGISATISAPILLLGKRAFSASVSMQKLKLGLEATTGSAEAAAAKMVKLREVAKLPGLGLEEAVQGAISLQQVGFEAEKSTRLLKAFGNAVATTGGGRVELGRILVQLTQMKSAGKVMLGDLRPILQTAPLIGKALMQAFGTINTAEINKQVGGDSGVFIDRLLAELEKMPKVAGGLSNDLENLSDAWHSLMVKIGDVVAKRVTPALNKLSEVVGFLSAKWDSLTPAMQDTIVQYGLIAAAVGPAVVAVGGFIASVGLVVSGMAAIPAVVSGAVTALGLMLGPAGVIAVGVVAIGGLLVKLADLLGAFDGMKAAYEELQQSLNPGKIHKYFNELNAAKEEAEAAGDEGLPGMTVSAEDLKEAEYQIARLKAQNDAYRFIKAEEERMAAEAMARGAAIIEANRTPVEKLKMQLEELDKLKDMGVFAGAEKYYDRAVAAITKDLEALQGKSTFELRFNYEGISQSGSFEDLIQIEEQIARIQAMKFGPSDTESASDASKVLADRATTFDPAYLAAKEYLGFEPSKSDVEAFKLMPGSGAMIEGAAQDRKELEKQTSVLQELVMATRENKIDVKKSGLSTGT